MTVKVVPHELFPKASREEEAWRTQRSREIMEQEQKGAPGYDPVASPALDREIARTDKRVAGSPAPSADFTPAPLATQTYEVDVEGETYEVDAPDERTAWRWAKAEHAKRKPPTMFTPSGEKDTPSWLDPDMIAGNPVTRFALGAASPFLGIGQLAANLSERLYKATGIPFRPGEAVNSYLARLQEMKEQGRIKQGSEGFDLMETAGAMLSPAFLALLKVPVAASATGKIAQGAAAGNVAGVTTPVTDGGENFLEQKKDQAVFGTAVGAAVPAALLPASKIVSMAYQGLIEPWAVPVAVKGRAFLEAAGDKADDIIALLRSPQREIVPGSRPTAGQAAAPAGRAEFSALQRSAEGVRPSDYVARADEQNAARIAQVRTVGKDKATLEAAETERGLTTGQLYKEAFDTMVKRDPELRKLWKNPYFRKSIGEAWELAKSEGVSPRKDLTQFLHFVKVGLDTQLAGTPTGPALSSIQKRAIQGVKKSLVEWIEAKNPAYEAARTTFAEKSAPINQMKVGQYLEEKLVPALSEEAKQSATQYANALRNAPNTIKRAAGGPRFEDLSKVLDPDQLRAVESVRDDLARLARHDTLAAKGAAAAPNAIDLATNNLKAVAGGKIPNLLDRGFMVANAIISRVQGKIDAKLAAEMAVEMLNPSHVAKSLAEAKARAAFNARMVEDLHKTLRYWHAEGVHVAGKRKQNPSEEEEQSGGY